MTNQRFPNVVLERVVTFISGGLGLVAALAWNDAIRALFEQLFRTERNGIVAKFLYAALVTVIVVLVTVRLIRLSGNGPTGGSQPPVG